MYIDELELLLQEKYEVRQKISTVMKKLKEWFMAKINELGDLFRHVKNSVSEGLRNIKNRKGKINKDININGETIIPKNTPVSTVTNSIQSDLSNLQITTKVVIQDCKDGIHYIDDDDKDKAVKTKTKVMDKIKNITLIITPIMAGVFALTLYKKNESERKRFETKINKIKSDIASDVKNDVKSELKTNREAEEDATYYTDLVTDVSDIVPTPSGNDSRTNSIKKTVKTVYKILDKLDKRGMI